MPRLGRLRFLLSLGAVLGFALMASTARAGPLTLILTAADGATVTIAGPPIGTFSNDGNSLTVTNIALLNAFLAANGTLLQLNTLSASSDFAPNAGDPIASFVSLTGSLYYDTALSGSGTLTVEVLQAGFLLPTASAGGVGTLFGSSVNSFNMAPAGSFQTFGGIWSDPVYSAPLTSTSTGLMQNNYSLSNLTAIPMFVTPFQLSSVITFNILPNSNATDAFTGSTGATAAAIPEPASVVLMSISMPLTLVLVGWLRRRRAA